MSKLKLCIIIGAAGFLWAHLVAHDIPSRGYWDQFRAPEELAAMRPQDGTPPPAPAPGEPDVIPGPCGQGELAAVMATIKELESGNRYHVPPNKGGASGAYQFIKSTWDAVAERAGRRDLKRVWPYQASPADQDALARQHIGEAMPAGVENIPAIWYVGHVPTSEREWNTVPRPDAGNTKTVRQYQQMWLAIYRKHLRCES